MGDALSASLFAAVCPGYNAETTFSLTFSLDSLSEKPMTEMVVVGKHLKWYLSADQATNNGEEFLRTSMFTEDWYKYPMSYETEYTLEANDPKDSIVQKESVDYGESDYTLSGGWMIACDRLLNERDKFEVDGKLRVIAKISIRMPVCYNFNGSSSLSDVAIKIGPASFPLNKTVLAFHSNFFHSMFFGQFAEANQDEVALVDVDAVAFVKLINVLFVRSFKLKMNSMASVLESADRFGIFSILNHCEELLVECGPEITLAEKLALATKYSLDKLLKQCLVLCTSTNIIKEVTNSPFYKDISDEGKLMLFGKMVEIVPGTGKTRCPNCSYHF